MAEESARGLLPHSGNMVLIDDIIESGEQTLSARTTVRPGTLFDNPDGSWPAWIGLELMAQSVAAWAGCQARAAGRPVQLGFLLGTRQYTCNVADFPAGATLRIDVEQTLQDASGIGVFECSLHGGGILATARVSVFQPTDTASYLAAS